MRIQGFRNLFLLHLPPQSRSNFMSILCVEWNAGAFFRPRLRYVRFDVLIRIIGPLQQIAVYFKGLY